jgi:[ribosomal protein S5]-alanine N-acetyltransferase
MSTALESTRLRLRPCAAADVVRLVEHWSQPSVRRFLFDDQITNADEVAGFIEQSERNFAELGFGLWTLTDKADERFCGVCGFLAKEGTPDLLFSIEPAHWGKGLATEAARSVIKYAFDKLGVPQIIASVDQPNTVSIVVLEKLGMQRTEEKLTHGNPILSYVLTATVC